MQGIVHFQTFLLTGIMLNLTPGNDTIFILSKSLTQGRRAGIISALGIASGSVLHTLLAAFGLSLFIATSPMLYSMVKYAGAIYLVYLGCRIFFQKEEFNAGLKQGSVLSNRRIYRDAMLTNLLNPKVALFFIAFLPQFIDPQSRHDVAPFIVLGVTFIFTGTAWCMMLAIFSSEIFRKLQANNRVAVYMNRICGTALVLVGFKVAFTDSR
ncbi:MAG TPA: LysE family translocator [Flavitalea sp.]|nr:LysE family translocator [Flavitalea sp.]